MTLKDYINALSTQWATGVAREHSYRPALQEYLQSILGADYLITNEPARQDCGAPDYMISRGGVALAFVEAKDINDKDLRGLNDKGHREQFDRYKQALDVVLFTDYLDFYLYIRGEEQAHIRLGETEGKHIKAYQHEEEHFVALVQMMVSRGVQSVRSLPELTRLMASKAFLLQHSVQTALSKPKEQHPMLHSLLTGFRQTLMHDLSESDFADTYAQTIVYGLFAARYNDPTLENFSRAEASTLIPQTNPFLRSFFASISGIDLDSSIEWIVENLVAVFRATDLKTLFREYGERSGMNDPLMHFYEDFLTAYNPKLRKDRGVWYTSEAVVRFMVQAVDEILQSDFDLEGIEDNSKIHLEYQSGSKTQTIKIKGKTETIDVPIYHKEEIHRVQFLDPATGTGTFPAEIIRQIYAKYKGNEGLWTSALREDILPRLNAFEYLMAPYAIAHLKLSMLLAETGYEARTGERLRIFLTNSLEEHSPVDNVEGLFGLQLDVAQEAKAADTVKEHRPIMVMIGNPPYNVSSSNKGKWIEKLREDYKPEGEQNIQPLSDDYIKFIRLGQHFVEKNGEGILCFITNNTFIDGIIHREMRRQLMQAFDKCYILDLHGNAKKKEQAPDGGKDENVFDIQQGVSINIFVKLPQSQDPKQAKPLASVYHYDLFGRRKDKHAYLLSTPFSQVPFTELQPTEPYYFFVPKDFSEELEYSKGFKVDELFKENSVGITTTKDGVNIWQTPQEVITMLTDLQSLPEESFRERYAVGTDSRDWSIARAKEDVGSVIDLEKVVPIDYRPFDRRYLYYTRKTNGLVAWPRGRIFKNFLHDRNLALVLCKQQSLPSFQHVFLSTNIIDNCSISTQTKERTYSFPLYLYEEELGEGGKSVLIKRRNLNEEIVASIEAQIGENIVAEELFDYIYSILHRREYREKYREFLKIDFPRIPYPESLAAYRLEVERGGVLRRLHLMEDLPSELKLPHRFPEAGSNFIEKPQYKHGRVYINKEQYFDGVDEAEWSFYIGGYQPAQKWLKDRKGQTLSAEDIKHYRRMLYVLARTHEIMSAD